MEIDRKGKKIKKYRVFKYCGFFEVFKIFRTLAFLCFPSVLHGELGMRLMSQLPVHVYSTSIVDTQKVFSDCRAFIEIGYSIKARKISQPSKRAIFSKHFSSLPEVS